MVSYDILLLNNLLTQVDEFSLKQACVCSNILEVVRKAPKSNSAAESGPTHKVLFPKELGWADGWVDVCLDCGTDGR